MPLLNPLVPNGGYKDLVIPYFGGEIAIGKVDSNAVKSEEFKGKVKTKKDKLKALRRRNGR